MSDLVIANKQDLVDIASTIRDKVGTIDEIAFPDGFIDIISGIESSEFFTFIPANTGRIFFDIKDRTNVLGVFWYNTGNIDVGTANEAIAGFTIKSKDTTQQFVCLYNKGTYPSSLSAGVYRANCSYNDSVISTPTYYGGAMLQDANSNNLSFYANEEGSKGIRVGDTYKVIIVRK